MKRTSRRPLVVNGHGTIKPWEALAWGITLGAGATLLLGLMATGWPPRCRHRDLVLRLRYTLLLKRRSPANIVIGGAAGCFPCWSAGRR